MATHYSKNTRKIPASASLAEVCRRNYSKIIRKLPARWEKGWAAFGRPQRGRALRARPLWVHDIRRLRLKPNFHGRGSARGNLLSFLPNFHGRGSACGNLLSFLPNFHGRGSARGNLLNLSPNFHGRCRARIKIEMCTFLILLMYFSIFVVVYPPTP